jgi:hypothetical protein
MLKSKNQTLFINFHLFYGKITGKNKKEFGKNHQITVIPAELKSRKMQICSK